MLQNRFSFWIEMQMGFFTYTSIKKGIMCQAAMETPLIPRCDQFRVMKNFLVIQIVITRWEHTIKGKVQSSCLC